MTLEEWFDNTFWPLYPNDLARGKKGPKTVAKKAMVKLDPDEVMRQGIINKLRVLIRSAKSEQRVGQDPDRWPFASTWINQERWNSVEDMDMPSTIVDKRNCECGAPATWKTLCNKCYQNKYPDAGATTNPQMLHDIFIANGLLHDESKSDRALRCQQFLADKGFRL